MRFIPIFWLLLLFTLVTIPQATFASDNEFTIQPGDILHVSVWKEDGMDREVLVLPDGTITFPLVGTIEVKNTTLADTQNSIKEKLEPFIPDAVVTVAINSPLGHTVSILGQVKKPGTIVMSGNMSVLQALSQAEGLTPYADDDDIVIIRRTEKGKESIEYPYDDITKGKDLSKDIDLKPGDVIFVPTSGLF